MGVLIRVGAYALSALAVWNFISTGANSNEFVALHKHLALDTSKAMIFGVCSGFSNYTGFDVTLIRFAWVLAALYRGLGIVLYIIAFLIMPTV